MKLLSYLFFVLMSFSYSCNGAQPEVAPVIETATWTEVHNISAISAHITKSEKGVFMLDADETLFTTTVVEGAPKLVRLYDDLEGLLAPIRKAGHKVFILTFNTEEEILRKLSVVGFDVTAIDGILACGMKGDLMTAKGDLLKRHVEMMETETETPYAFAVFIDNFPPFVRNVQNVAKELGLPLHSYLCTGYIDLYHGYVYYHLSKLQKDLAEDSDVAAPVERIQKSLAKYRIDIARFTEQYPTFESFKRFAVDQALIWPYLTYL
jgi:hypothetical protein